MTPVPARPQTGSSSEGTRPTTGAPVTAEDRSTPATDVSASTGIAVTAAQDTVPVEDAVGGDDVPREGLPHADDGRPGDDVPGDPPRGDGLPTGEPGWSWWRRRAVLVPAGAVAVLAAAYGADLLISSGDIPRGTVVGGIEIGGLSPAAAAETLQAKLAPKVHADRPVVADVAAALS